MLKIKSDAARIYWASIQRPNQWVPSYGERMYYETLEFCAGKELPSAVLREGEVCAHIPADVKCFHHTPRDSKIMALAPEYVEWCDGNHTDPAVEPRVSTGDGAWWKQPEHNLDVVRVLTTWVDGFMGFVPHKGT